MPDDYLINNRSYTIYLSINEELSFAGNENYLFDLSYLSLVKVAGAQAMQFLQGQLTCDVQQVNEHNMRPGALCNLQGRIQALIDVIYWQGNFYLVLPADLVEMTITTLSKAAMLSRVKLEPMQQQYNIYGLFLNNKLTFPIALPQERFAVSSKDESCCYAIADHHYLLVLPTEETAPIELNHHEFKGSLAWHYLLLKQKLVQIYPSTKGMFLPHRLGLHLSGFISFDKGCYKGQEIIARTHYRAKLKHSLQLFTIQTATAPAAGHKLYNNENLEIGEIIDYCPVANDTYLIAASIMDNHPNQVRIEQQRNFVDLNDDRD